MGNLGLKPKKNREFYDWFMITDTRDIDLYWFILIYIDLYWFRLIYIDLYWFILIYIDLHRFILIYIDLYWFTLIYIDFCWFMINEGLTSEVCQKRSADSGASSLLRNAQFINLGYHLAGWWSLGFQPCYERQIFQWLRSHQRMSGKTSVHFADFMCNNMRVSWCQMPDLTSDQN